MRGIWEVFQHNFGNIASVSVQLREDGSVSKCFRVYQQISEFLVLVLHARRAPREASSYYQPYLYQTDISRVAKIDAIRVTGVQIGNTHKVPVDFKRMLRAKLNNLAKEKKAIDDD